MSYGGKGLAENVRIPSYSGEGSKIAQKPSYDIRTFPKVVASSYNGRYPGIGKLTH